MTTARRPRATTGWATAPPCRQLQLSWACRVQAGPAPRLQELVCRRPSASERCRRRGAGLTCQHKDDQAAAGQACYHAALHLASRIPSCAKEADEICQAGRRSSAAPVACNVLIALLTALLVSKRVQRQHGGVCWLLQAHPRERWPHEAPEKRTTTQLSSWCVIGNGWCCRAMPRRHLSVRCCNRRSAVQRAVLPTRCKQARDAGSAQTAPWEQQAF